MKKLMVLSTVAAVACAASAWDGSVKLENRFGTCEIALRGAQVMSCAFKGDEYPLLFTPARGYDFDPRKIGGCPFIQGGVPLLWPWFGGSGAPSAPEGYNSWWSRKKREWGWEKRFDPPFHAMARYSLFTADKPVETAAGTSVTLRLTRCPEVEEYFPYDYELAYTITLGDHSLTLDLVTKNTGDRAFPLRSGYHPYFDVANCFQTTMDGFDGCRYDSTRDLPYDHDHIWRGTTPEWPGCDIYRMEEPKSKVTVTDLVRRRAIVVETTGAKDVVTWVQDAKGAEGVNIMKCEAYRYVCVEPANYHPESEVTLEPGKSHRFCTKMSVKPLK